MSLADLLQQLLALLMLMRATSGQVARRPRVHCSYVGTVECVVASNDGSI
jgi:hypothetical protein